MAFNSAYFEAYKNKKLDIAESNYLQAQLYYMDLQKAFEKSLKESAIEIGKQEKEKRFTEIISNSLDDSFDYTNLINTYEEEIISFFNTDTKFNSIKRRLERSLKAVMKKSLGKKTKLDTYWDAVSKEFDTEFEKYYTSKELELNCLEMINNTTQKLNLGQATQSPHGAYAFFKRVLFNRLAKSTRDVKAHANKYGWKFLSDESKRGYSHLIGGYLREVVTNKAIDDFLSKNNSSMRSWTTNDGNEYYDLVIGEENDYFDIFKDIKNELEDLERLVPGYASINDVEIFQQAKPYFGIQAKSWSSPDDILAKGGSLRNNWFKIGDRENILRSIPELNKTYYDWDRGWHNSVAICSKIIYQLIGQYQVAYSLPGRLVWTYDLIRQMHENKMYLSFYFTRERSKDKKEGYFHYPATKEVAWQKRMYLYAFYTKSLYPNKK